jgi:hypothetical protein
LNSLRALVSLPGVGAHALSPTQKLDRILGVIDDVRARERRQASYDDFEAARELLSYRDVRVQLLKRKPSPLFNARKLARARAGIAGIKRVK